MSSILLAGGEEDLVKLLKKQGNEVGHFTRVQQGIESLQAQSYPVLICEASNGCSVYFDLIKLYQSQVNKGLVVVLSCSDSSSNIQTLLGLGVSYILPALKEVSTLVELLIGHGLEASNGEVDHQTGALDTRPEQEYADPVIEEINSEAEVTESIQGNIQASLATRLEGSKEIRTPEEETTRKSPNFEDTSQGGQVSSACDSESVLELIGAVGNESEDIQVENAHGTSLGKILIVDDDHFVIKTMEYFLKKHHYEVSTLEDPLKIHERMKSGSYDVILMDFNMPGVNGAEVIRDIRNCYGEVFVVGITAAFEKEVIDEFLKAGAFTVLKKPFETKRLLQMLSKLHLHSKVKTKSNLKAQEGKDKESSRLFKSLRLVLVASLFMAFLMWFVETRIEDQSQADKDSVKNRPSSQQYNDDPGNSVEELKEEIIQELKNDYRKHP